MRRTKIVATIGPASRSREVISRLIAEGIDIARLNSSHASVPELDSMLVDVRAAASDLGRSIAVMLDLAGPKLRVGDVADGTVLIAGSEFILGTVECVGDARRACVTHSTLADDLAPGDRVLLDDGRIELEVRSIESGDLHTSVVVGGPLTSHKGVNVPGVTLGVDATTDADHAALEWALQAGVDFVAQSFVRDSHDVLRLRELMGDTPVPIVAKIEKHEAAARIGDIVDAADAIMVARGDLGVETSPEEVPILQRRIIRACRAAGKPVVVATQMLESMVTALRPTRAEASDVANAIFEGADAVMLSAETAIGVDPSLAVATMARIAARAEEESLHTVAAERVSSLASGVDVTGAVSAAVCELAEDLCVAAILTATQSGATALAVARHRPNAPIVALTPSEVVARRLSIVWGVTPLVVGVAGDEDRALETLTTAARDAGIVEAGERVAITAGVARGTPGTTDLILVREVPSAH